MSEREPRLREPARTFRVAAAIAALGVAGCAAGLWVDPKRTLVAYLAAFVYGLSLALGALCLVLIAHASDARWFVVVRRVAEAIAGTLPAFALLFIPVACGLGTLYPWAAPGASAHPGPPSQRAYLNVPFFLLRAVVYLAVWSGLQAALSRWSVRQDGAAPARGERPLLLSGLGLMAFGFTITFAAFDWLMSLDPTWSSTAFGLYYFAGAVVGALGLMAVVVWGLEREGTLDGRIAGSHYHALGRLALTFVVFWAYIAYAQGFLIWIADIPREAGWYLRRLSGGWGAVLVVLVASHFVVPFFALLSRPLKRSGAAMAAVGVWLLVAHYVDLSWVVLPALDRGAAHVGWEAIPPLMLVLGAGAAVAVRRFARHAAIPIGDPDLPASLEYRSL